MVGVVRSKLTKCKTHSKLRCIMKYLKKVIRIKLQDTTDFAVHSKLSLSSYKKMTYILQSSYIPKTWPCCITFPKQSAPPETTGVLMKSQILTLGSLCCGWHSHNHQEQSFKESFKVNVTEDLHIQLLPWHPVSDHCHPSWTANQSPDGVPCRDLHHQPSAWSSTAILLFNYND